jgi:hypothetical protein
MGSHSTRFRDRLPLSPLTLQELVDRSNLWARLIANEVRLGRPPDPVLIDEYSTIVDAKCLRLGLPVSGRS